MKGVFTLTLLLFYVSFQSETYAQDTTTRDALLGNSPRTTLTTGIGQVVKPVGIPVILSPLSVQQNPQKPSPRTLTDQDKKLREKEKLPLEAEKIEGKYELGKVPQKEEGKEEKTNYPLLSDQTNRRYKTVYSTPQGKAKVIRIPYADLPTAQKISSQ